jgi:hypothetical protein
MQYICRVTIKSGWQTKLTNCVQALKTAVTRSNLGRAGLDEASIQQFARYATQDQLVSSDSICMIMYASANLLILILEAW